MRTLALAVFCGLGITFAKLVLLTTEHTYWDITVISVSGLMAGIFFILAMTFQAALRDYKRGESILGTIRSVILTINDLNNIAKLSAGKKYDVTEVRNSLKDYCALVKKYIRGHISFIELFSPLDTLNTQLFSMQEHLILQHRGVLIAKQGDLREAVSQLAYIKDVRFSKTGYIFLYCFIAILLIFQLFAHSSNTLLELVFIFSLSTVLIFFARLIQDLDACMSTTQSTFRIDTKALENTVKILEIEGKKK